jgi:apolipoprotein N-acyltransferase
MMSGILFSVPFFIPELNILSFFAGVPFFYILFRELKNKKAGLLRKTAVFGMSFYIPVYIWFLWMYPMEQTGLTPLQSAFIVVAACLIFPVHQTFCMLILPAGLKIFNNANKNIFFLPLLSACLYVILEWVQSWFFTGLTWAKLSISQYRNLFFIQSASVLGTYFISFIIIFINASVALYILNKAKNQKYNLLIFAAVLLYFTNSYFGFFRIYLYDRLENNNPKITAQIVQGNISSYEKWEEWGGRNSLEMYKSLIEDYNSGKIDIVVLPETAIPMTIHYNSVSYEYMRNVAVNNNITLFAGAIYRNDDTYNRYNAIMAFDKNHDFIKPYGKQHLVPFGEYLPAEDILTRLFPFISNMTLFNSVLTPGEGPNLMTVNGVNYGGLVCFDSIFPELARKSVKDGADILIIVTNDSWFRDSTAKPQHNAQAVMRAVENNRYVIRSANTGISSFISPVGRIMQQSNILQREVLTGEVQVVKTKTVYTVAGDVILYFSWGFMAWCIILAIVNKKYRFLK